MTTVDGQTIPLQLMTHDGQNITQEMENHLQHVGVQNSEDMVSTVIKLLLLLLNAGSQKNYSRTLLRSLSRDQRIRDSLSGKTY
jgi:hypothetical protein